MEGGTPSTKVRRRAGVICMSMSILFVLLAVRILFYQTFQFDEFEQNVIDQMTQETSVSADRGNIYDCNGVMIATNITTYRLFLDPAAIMRKSREDGKDYADLIAKGIAAIDTLEVSYEEVIEQAGYTKYRDRTLKRHISEEQANAVRLFLEESELDDMALLHLQATSKRYYPYESLACHVLGFTGSDGNGLFGLEQKYDSLLAGTDGKYIGAKDSFGNEMVYDYESYIPAIDGYNITTTIDVYIQAELEEQLKTTYIESGGKQRATGIVMDVNTGAILAMAVYPSYDLNDPWTLDYQSQEKLDAADLDKDSDEYTAFKQQLLLEMWANKAVSELYMPGSTFKVVTAAMAYEENIVKENELFNCDGSYQVGVHNIHCHYHAGHGNLNFARGLQQSCNPVLMQMGLRLGADAYLRYFDAFGYFEKTGLDVSGESFTQKGTTFWNDGIFKSADIYLATASFGQNFKISPVGHLTAISAIANGGYLMEPYLVKEVTDGEGNVVYSHETTVRRQVVSESTCKTVTQILEEGVSGDGGAKNAYVAGYRIAAKTGTSEKKDTEREGYIPYVCSTVAYAPAEAPEIAALIMVDEPTEPKGLLYASVIAAPYIGALMEEVLPYYGVEAVYTEEEAAQKTLKTPALVAGRTEFVKGFAEDLGFKVEVVGDGEYVKHQSPAAGTEVEPGSAKIILYTTDEAVRDEEMVKVPNLSGMTAVAANGTLVNMGLNIKITGNKNNLSSKDVTVVDQSHAAGTLVAKGTVINVTFHNSKDVEEDAGIDIDIE